MGLGFYNRPTLDRLNFGNQRGLWSRRVHIQNTRWAYDFISSPLRKGLIQVIKPVYDLPGSVSSLRFMPVEQDKLISWFLASSSTNWSAKLSCFFICHHYVNVICYQMLLFWYMSLKFNYRYKENTRIWINQTIANNK